MSSGNMRQLIDRLIAEKPIIRLASAADGSPDACRKAGILPFLPASTLENWRFLLMQPVATRPEKGPPAFQLAKGTRMHWHSNAWQDITSGAAAGEQAESLAMTAVREGVEEVGIHIGGMRRLFDAGEVSFTSTRSGKITPLRLFAAEMENEMALLHECELAHSTAARRWMSCAQIAAEARADHAEIITRVAAQLAALYPVRDV